MTTEEKEELFKKLRDAVSVTYDPEAATAAASEVLKKNLDPLEAINEVSSAIREVGDRFHRGEAYLPQLVIAGDAMTAALTVLETALSKEQRASIHPERIVFGTVKGDIHDIGKNIVIMILRSAGFDVSDMGVDVSNSKFVSEAQEKDAHVICASSLLTVTMEEITDLIQDLKRMRLRARFKVVAGGGAVTRDWTEEIGADGYGRDAAEAVKTISGLVQRL
jgi:methylmalonyl-CoA mutase cobalamin-binding domain/chain